MYNTIQYNIIMIILMTINDALNMYWLKYTIKNQGKNTFIAQNLIEAYNFVSRLKHIRKLLRKFNVRRKVTAEPLGIGYCHNVFFVNNLIN